MKAVQSGDPAHLSLVRRDVDRDLREMVGLHVPGVARAGRQHVTEIVDANRALRRIGGFERLLRVPRDEIAIALRLDRDDALVDDALAELGGVALLDRLGALRRRRVGERAPAREGQRADGAERSMPSHGDRLMLLCLGRAPNLAGFGRRAKWTN